MAVLWVLRGDPLYFSHVQVHWNRHLAAPWASVSRSIHEILLHTAQTRRTSESGDRTVVHDPDDRGPDRRLPQPQAVVLGLHAAVDRDPMSTSSLMSMPRFALVLFPMFMVLAQWGEAVGEQRDCRLLASAARVVYGALRRLVLGGVEQASLVRRLTRRRGVRQFVKFGIVGASGIIVNLILVHDTPRTTQLPCLARRVLRQLHDRRRLELYPEPLVDVPFDRNPGAKATQFLTVSFLALAGRQPDRLDPSAERPNVHHSPLPVVPLDAEQACS